jgi:hypothetical protein
MLTYRLKRKKMIEKPQLTLSQLIDESGYKSDALGNKMGYSKRTTWWRKRQNLDAWTTEDIKRMAILLNKTPLEIYSALYFEVQHSLISVIPPMNTADKEQI